MGDLHRGVKSGGIVLNLSNNISSSITTKLLSHTINGRLAYIFISRKLVHGGRNSFIRGAFASLFSVGFIHMGYRSRFVGTLGKMSSPRRGEGVVNARFCGIF